MGDKPKLIMIDKCMIDIDSIAFSWYDEDDDRYIILFKVGTKEKKGNTLYFDEDTYKKLAEHLEKEKLMVNLNKT